jgi:copper chaperone CopZ
MRIVKTLLALAALGATSVAAAGTIEMTVHGLVCSFCAQSVEKTLRKNPATEDVVISLEHRLVVVSTKPGADIPDETLRKALEASGYDVKAIVRTERSIASIRKQMATEG